MKCYIYYIPIAVFALAGCKNSVVDRSLIFSTNTSLGLEVAVNPSGTEAPAKILIGYKRFEGVLDPLYQNLDPGGKAGASSGRKVTDYYLNEAYSVLAKFQGSASGAGGASSNTNVAIASNAPAANAAPGAAPAAPGATPPNQSATISANVSGGVTMSQWFATGEAAKILARYGGGALSDNPGVAAAVSAAAAQQPLSDRLLALPSQAQTKIYESVYRTLRTINTPDSNKLADALDSAASKLVFDHTYDIPAVYDFNPTTKTLTANPPATVNPATVPFLFMVGRLQEIEDSLDFLKTAAPLAAQAPNPLHFTDPLAAGVQIGNYVNKANLDPDRFDKTINFYEPKDASLKKAIAAMPEFRAAVQYIAVQLGLKE